MVEIVAILDRSGSMSGLEKEVIGAFNTFLAEQKAQPGKARMTLILFDDKYEVVYSRKALSRVPKLTSDVYFTRGMTALNDAVGKAIMSVDDADKVIVLIQTDGYENASQEYTVEVIKSLVEKKQAAGWEFHFIGAGIDAFSAGTAIGVRAAHTYSVGREAHDMATIGATMSMTSGSYRMANSGLDDDDTLDA